MTRLKHLPLLALVAAASAVAWPLEAADGVLIVEKTTTGGKSETHQIQIEKDRMRAETGGLGGGSEKQAVIFDGARQVLWIVNLDKKTYSEMTKADVDRLGGQMAGAMAQMQEQLKNMPPEQRAQIEAMMRGRGMPTGAPAAPAKPEFKRAGTEKVGKWTCDKYEGFTNNQKTSEICTVDPKDVGFAAADFEITRQLGEFFRKLVPQAAEQMFSFGKPEEQGFSGFPVKRVTGSGTRQTISETTDVSRQNFPASTFEVPQGFQKEDMFGGRGRGR